MRANPIARLREVKEVKPSASIHPRNNDGTPWPPWPVWVGGQPVGLLLTLTRPYSAEGHPVGLLLALTKVH
jgi:hypothetical protein